jgi:hypothetical protein
MADLSETLDALERKLRDLESELGAPSLGAPPPPPPGAPVAPRPAGPPPAAGLEDLARQIDDLSRFRDQLQRIGRELEDEYARVMARLGAAEAPAPAAPPTPATPAPPRDAEGTVVLEAGPFADLAALGAAEDALRRAPGVEAVDVTGVEGRRAVLELRLERAAALGDLVAAALVGATIRPASAPGRFTVELAEPR